MKKDLHPDYELTKITCACGNVIETRSTVKNIDVEICSACHPFFTGKQKLVDTAGRIERFNKRFNKRGFLKSGRILQFKRKGKYRFDACPAAQKGYKTVGSHSDTRTARKIFKNLPIFAVGRMGYEGRFFF